MRDPRVDNLARILVSYSIKLKEGETCAIRGPSAGEPLIAAVYEEALRAGATRPSRCRSRASRPPIFATRRMRSSSGSRPIARWEAEECDANIVIGAETNTRELSQVPPERQAKRRAATRALMETTMRRSAEGSFRWVYTLFPTSAYASDAEMSLADFEDFYYGACFADADDPRRGLAQGGRGVEAARGLDRGPRGGPRDRARDRHHARHRRSQVHRRGRRAQHARRRVLHGADRGLGGGRGVVPPSRDDRRPRGRRRSPAVRGRQGSRCDAPSAARTSW